ncbi:MAG: PBP1A family penicillin-binding protein [Pseudomonadota bacterium]
MEAILVKVFATALALSQVVARPDAVKTQFDPEQDKAEVVRVLNDGCTYMKKAFDIENLDIDDLITTAMTDTKAGDDEIKAFKGVKFSDLFTAYKEICKKEKVEKSVIDAGEVIDFYNLAMANLPDHTRLKGLKLPGMSNVTDAGGKRFAELFEPNHRRISIPISQVPQHVKAAFIAAEDKRFMTHKGVDERSVIRAFMTSVADTGKRQGGSTITQQVVKNLLVGDDISYERKMREIVIASRVEHTLSKDEILELYLNAIYFGRGAWGIEMAARTYFGKSAKDLTIQEGALLAGLTKGPNYYSPDRHRDRAKERLAYVLDRMEDDGAITTAQRKDAEAAPITLTAYQRPRRDTGFAFVDQLYREARTLPNVGSLTGTSFVVRSTIEPELQKAAEAAMQDGLAKYEQSMGRTSFRGPEANLSDAVKKVQADPKADQTKPAWQLALMQAQPPLYDVHWTPAIVMDKTPIKGGFDSIRVGLRDGRTLPLSTFGSNTRRLIGMYDLVYVQIIEGKGKEGTRVELRSRPTVQGAAIVLENKTGRILAMVGGFSYPLSQLNRATQSRRQPGSSFKPMSYLAALASGLQPNTLVNDGPITLPPIGDTRYAQAKDYWSPKNYDGGGGGQTTLRRALEQSKNLVTAHLLDGGIAPTPAESLDKVCQLAMEAQIYQQCERYYPFILGAQPVRVIDMAAFYAAVANEGMRPNPHAIEQVEKDGEVIYKSPNRLVSIGSADRPAFFQLRTMLQGVVARGTAARISALSPFVAGKTGTSDDENDTWFAGFSNDVTIVVWVGYDNAGRVRRTLGHGATGGRVALPIWENIMQAAWKVHAPRVPLPGPSPEAAKQLIALPIDVRSGQRIEATSSRYSQYPQYGQYGEQQQQPTQRFMEYFRLDPTGRMQDSQYKLVSRESPFGAQGPEEWDQERGLFYRRDSDTGLFGNPSGLPRAPEPRFRSQGGLFGNGFPFPFTPPWAQPQYESQQQQQQAPQTRQQPQTRQRTQNERSSEQRPQVRGQRTQPDYLAPQRY